MKTLKIALALSLALSLGSLQANDLLDKAQARNADLAEKVESTKECIQLKPVLARIGKMSALYYGGLLLCYSGKAASDIQMRNLPAFVKFITGAHNLPAVGSYVLSEILRTIGKDAFDFSK